MMPVGNGPAPPDILASMSKGLAGTIVCSLREQRMKALRTLLGRTAQFVLQA